MLKDTTKLQGLKFGTKLKEKLMDLFVLLALEEQLEELAVT